MQQHKVETYKLKGNKLLASDEFGRQFEIMIKNEKVRWNMLEEWLIILDDCHVMFKNNKYSVDKVTEIYPKVA